MSCSRFLPRRGPYRVAGRWAVTSRPAGPSASSHSSSVSRFGVGAGSPAFGELTAQRRHPTPMRVVRHPFVDDVAGERFGVFQRGAATWTPGWACWTRALCIDVAVRRATRATAISGFAAWRPGLARAWCGDERHRIARRGPVLQAFERARRAGCPDAWNSHGRLAVGGVQARM